MYIIIIIAEFNIILSGCIMLSADFLIQIEPLLLTHDTCMLQPHICTCYLLVISVEITISYDLHMLCMYVIIIMC